MKASCCCLVAALIFLSLTGVRGDQVQMQNGDRYMGKVVSFNADTLTLENDVLGTLKLPRSKVSTVTFGAVPPGAGNSARPAPRTNATPAASVSSNTAPELSAALRQLLANNNKSSAGEQDHTKLLEAAGPEAKSKFNELLGGLMTGKLTIADIRAQAKTVADQARALQSDLGEDGSGVLDGYLAILDKFLSETAPKPESRPATPPKPAKP